jgi:hypothetical protein
MMREMSILLQLIFSLVFNFRTNTTNTTNTTNKPITYGPLAIIYNYKSFSQK